MQRSIILLLFAFAFSISPQYAQAGREICGVDLSKSRRCWKELRRLRKACQDNPTIAGQRYTTQRPNLLQAKRAYSRLRRINRRTWIKSLCGVALYSPPRSFCGAKGVEVAVRCISQHISTSPAPPVIRQTQKTAAVTKQAPKPRQQLAAIAKQPAPRAPSGILRERPKHTQPSPKVGQVQTQGSSWSFYLQLLTFLLVGFLLYRMREHKSSRKPWEQHEEWEQRPLTWEGPAFDQDKDLRDLESFQFVLNDAFEAFEKKWAAHWTPPVRKSMAQLQESADQMFEYYCILAKQIVQHSSEVSITHIHKQLLNANEKLSWIFRSHREPNASSFIEQFQEDSLSQLTALLDTSGYIDLEQMIQHMMASGRFSLEDYLTSKTEDQARLFFEGEPLQKFEDIQGEFLHHLERLYQSNLRAAKDVINMPTEVSKDEQERLYFENFILVYLMDWMPKQLQQITQQSNPSRVGALVDQLIVFTEQQLEKAQLELFPSIDPNIQESLLGRVLHLKQAGIRHKKDQTIILREPHPSLVPSEQEDLFGDEDAVSTEVHVSPGASFEQKGVVSNLDAFEFESELSGAFDALSASLDATAGQGPISSGVTAGFETFGIDEEDASNTAVHPSPSSEEILGTSTPRQETLPVAKAPAISHPDSDAPENEMSTLDEEGLAPLHTTQSFVPSSRLPAKVTSEYAKDEHHSASKARSSEKNS
ncbi:MAG: hypothetical protein CL920_22120 [Deltaproteobacteria bacterium]|nr:hypothetical protein [Deltaproteobacteria bacterium]MBU51394.1 hypothetical protein [Deltaproteobacteria bacterium]